MKNKKSSIQLTQARDSLNPTQRLCLFFELLMKIDKRNNPKIMKVQKVEIVPIKPHDGLMGFATVVIGDSLYLSSIGVHKRRDGSGFRITYPTKKVGDVNVSIFHPVDKKLSKEIEQAIIEKAVQIFM